MFLDSPFVVVSTARRNIYMDSQHPQGWEKIQNLEQRPKYERIEVADAPLLAPRFTSELRVSPLGLGRIIGVKVGSSCR